jgi:hypothetical protein
MNESISTTEAPCIAVIGPPNTGKTTLLHQLDQKLNHLDSFLVLKGNPDGTGRYFYHSPELRHDTEFQKNVKGKWGDATVERICEWVTHGRRNLSLALLDFGGRHDAETAGGNARMLGVCSHYLVVSRVNDARGAAFWDDVGRDHGLKHLGWMRSVLEDGPQPAVLDSEAGIQACFRVDVRPDDPINDAALAPLVDALIRLSRPPDRTAYVDLQLGSDWRIEQIADVGGRASRIAELARRTGVVVLGGGRTPVWAYLAGLCCALDARDDGRVFFYDPKQPERLVEIPAGGSNITTAPAEFPPGALSVSWRQEGTWSVLDIEKTAQDKFLPPTAAQNLAGAPVPPTAPTVDVALSGPGCPLWLFGTYARWLMAAGAQSLASWDGRARGFVEIWRRKRQA